MDQTMQELDVEGLFWLSTKAEAQVAGRLKFDVASGAELDLIGSFGGPESMMGDENELDNVRIHGVAGKKLLTLDGCRKSGGNLEMPGIYRERYKVSSIFSGTHFDTDESLEFLSVSVELRHLEYWVGRSGLSYSITEETASKEISNIQITLDPLEKASVTSSQGEVELAFTWGLFGNEMVEKGLRHGTYITFKPQTGRPLEDLMKVAMALQHLVTLGVDASAPVTSATFKHKTRTRTLGSGETVHDNIELFAQLQGGDSSPHRGAIQPYEMLFTLQDLGGLSGIAKWLDVAAKYESVIGTLLSHRYMPRMYMENRLQNAVFAAETFDRLRFPNRLMPNRDFKALVLEVLDAVPSERREWVRSQLAYSNEPRLKHRLLRLAEHAGPIFGTLVGDVEAWAKDLTEARNRSVHKDKKRTSVGGSEMYFLSETVYFLVSFCLLRESGLSEVAFTKMGDHRRFNWLREQVGNTRTSKS